MRSAGIAACAALLVLCIHGESLAQDAPASQEPAPPASPELVPPALSDPVPADGLRIEWEVKNRFRLFRSEADFQHHVEAHRAGGVLAAEQRLARASDGHGWAKDMLDRLCIDPAGRLMDVCPRDGERESYLSPQDHRIGAKLVGELPSEATCAWTFDDGDGTPQRREARCDAEVAVRVRYGRPTVVTVEASAPEQPARRASTAILVRDLLIAGLGDSIAAGEGNPDQAVALSDGGFCFRRFSGVGGEYFRPGRAGFRGDKACDVPDPTAASD